jgi:hypothetical protein
MKPIVIHEYILPDNTVDTSSLREDLFDYFNTLHYMLSDTEFNHISDFAKDWMDSHLLTHDHLENSVKEKAHELSTGNDISDYFNALLIRRDQLLAARDVFREYTALLRDVFSEEREAVMKHLASFDFDKGVYLRAEEYHKAREKALKEYAKNVDSELLLIEKEIAAVDDALSESVESKPKKKRAATKKSTISTRKKKTVGKSGRYFHKSI